MLFIIALLIALTIFAGRFFTSENKLKIAFEQGQTLAFFTAVYDENKNITSSTVLFFNTSTNRISTVYILPKTYISFGKSGFLTVEDILNKKVSKEDILKGLSTLLNIKINYYFLLSQDNFIKFIDMLGGVEIMSSEMSVPGKNIYFPKGLTLLDGDKALEYLQTELKDENEFEKLKRHQKFTGGILKLKADFSESFNNNIISTHFYKLYTTNLSVSDTLIIYNEINKRFQSGIHDFSKNAINIILYCDRKAVDAGYILLPKNTGNWIRSEVKDALVELKKEDTTVIGNKTVIQILNGTGINGFASRTKRYLESFGFEVYNTDNADHSDYENTLVIIRNSEAKAKKLANLIQCTRVVPGETTNNTNIDATIILGKDFDGKIVKN